ncbi:MAG: hypothetical protein ACRD1X_12725 [Vicinamibacteria bacterium]
MAKKNFENHPVPASGDIDLATAGLLVEAMSTFLEGDQAIPLCLAA